MVTVFLCGDVMTGRGVDQLLPHPSDPRLEESYVRDAREYVALAEAMNGPISQPVDLAWPWGEALAELERRAPDARVINLETSITRSDGFWPGKGIHYRMHPANIGCLTALRPDVCVLGNNHVLDFGYSGLRETLETLWGAGLRTAGAGRSAEESRRPAVVELPGQGRLLVFSLASETSGVAPDWAATADRPGVHFLGELSRDAADAFGELVRKTKQPGDLVIASIHWGSNWGYAVPPEQPRFAHRLIDAGVDLVHGHSSHHPRPIEVYRGRLILYGCGDFIDDYEGITGYEEFRDDLVLMYFPSLLPGTGELIELHMIPLQIRNMRLRRASLADSRWLAEILDAVSWPFGSRIDLEVNGMLALRPGGGRSTRSAARERPR